MYEGLEHAGRPVGNFYKVLAHKPEVLRAFLQLFNSVMGEGALPLKLKELALLEQLELIKNLELFEKEKEARPEPQGQP